MKKEHDGSENDYNLISKVTPTKKSCKMDFVGSYIFHLMLQLDLQIYFPKPRFLFRDIDFGKINHLKDGLAVLALEVTSRKC